MTETPDLRLTDVQITAIRQRIARRKRQIMECGQIDLGEITGTEDLRSYVFAKTLLMAGVPSDRVAILMGHRNSATTLKHYAAWVREGPEQLEGDVRRVRAQKERPRNDEKPLKRPESGIQPLCGNTPRWLN